MGRFEKLAMDFCDNTGWFGFNAVIELERLFDHDSEKGRRSVKA